jgi:RND family efflux transporter MFP subunit
VPNGQNGSPRSSPTRLPKARGLSRRGKLLLYGGAGLAVLLFLGVPSWLLIAKPFKGRQTELVPHVVKYERLELTIVERGALESAQNSDVYCRVKSGTKGATQGSTTIKTIIDDGTEVLKDRPKDQARTILVWDPKTNTFTEKTGNPNGFARVLELREKEGDKPTYPDLVMELDDSGLQDQLKQQKINLDKAEADKIGKEENYKIVVSQNQSDLKKAETDLELAQIDLEKYQNGDFPQSLKDVEGRIKTAESDLEQQRDRSAWAQRMLKKGYYTVSQSDAEQSKLQSLELTLAKYLEERRVLTDPKYGAKKRTETDLKNKVDQAVDALERTRGQAKAKEVQARTERETNKSLWEQAKSQYDEIIAEIKKCKIYAPQDGMVVYFVPEQARFGGGTQQSIVAQGEPVREGQKLVQIPDLRQMLVNVKVHEALVSTVAAGQPATIKVASFRGHNFKGKVESVATVSSQLDFFSADVKVYTTKVRILNAIEGLKPGMSGEVTITVGDPLERVLTVPIEGIVGSAELGARRQCYVLWPDGLTEARDIVVGQSNDTKAEIREGLKEGEVVVLNPGAIVGDSAKVRKAGQGKGEKGGEGDGEKVKGKGKKGGPDKSKGKGGPGKDGKRDGGAGSFSPEAIAERFRKAAPAERKQMLEQTPEQYRDKLREMLKGKGIDVPN